MTFFHSDQLKRIAILQPNVPFAPSRLRFFYGWVILVVTTLGIIMSIPGQTAGVSVFTDHLILATGLSRLSLSNAYLIGTLTSGLLLPIGGTWIDRIGARPIVVGASIWLALTLVYLSMSDRLALLLGNLLAIPTSTITFLLLCIGFVSLRFSGQGMLTLVSRTTLGKWFDRRRGMASGIAGLFLSFGFSAAPLLLSFFIDGLGWRGAWLSLALLVGLGMSSLGWLLYRDNPEECGLVMDGEAAIAPTPSREPSHPSQSNPANHAQARDFTRVEALRSLAFWAVTLALATQSLSVTGITFHIVDIGAAVGLAEKQTVALFLPIAVFSTLTGYLVGLMADRTQLRFLFMVMMVFEAIGITGMAHLDSDVFRLVAIAGLGISGGCFGTLSTVTMPRYFGRQHLGAIAGVEMMVLVMASAIGPSFLAMFNAVFGSYRMGLYLCAMLPLMIVFVLIPSRNPQNIAVDQG